MTTVREALQRLFRRPEPAPVRERSPDRARFDRAGYSYRVFWIKQARGWDAAQRQSVWEATRVVTAAGAFESNTFERRYQVQGLAGEHSGASLVALIQVLEALNAGE
jgi:hypothetical protein